MNKLIAVLALCGASLQALAAAPIQSWQQADGVRVYLIEAHQNPQLDVQIAFDAGERRTPLASPALAGMANSLIASGSRHYDEDALQQRWASLAVQFGSFVEADRAGFSLRLLSDAPVRDAAFDLLGELIAAPRLSAAVLERQRQQQLDGLRQSLTEAGFLASRHLTRQLYPQHPYGYEARLDAAALRRVKVADIQAFWRRYYRPSGAVVSLVGDIDRPAAEVLVRKLTAGLPATSQSLPALPEVTVPTHGALVNLAHPGSQAHVSIGLPVLSRDDPDYYALLLGNYILGGGGFDSRLMKELRDKRGLTYGAASEFEPRQQPGPFTLVFTTRKDQADAARLVALETLRSYLAEGPSEAELAQAKANLIGGFPLRLDSNAKQLAYLGVIGWYRLPLDFLEQYPRQLAAIDAAAIKDAWQRRIDPQRLQQVVVGGVNSPVSAAQPQ